MSIWRSFGSISRPPSSPGTAPPRVPRTPCAAGRPSRTAKSAPAGQRLFRPRRARSRSCPGPGSNTDLMPPPRPPKPPQLVFMPRPPAQRISWRSSISAPSPGKSVPPAPAFRSRPRRPRRLAQEQARFLERFQAGHNRRTLVAHLGGDRRVLAATCSIVSRSPRSALSMSTPRPCAACTHAHGTLRTRSRSWQSRLAQSHALAQRHIPLRCSGSKVRPRAASAPAEVVTLHTMSTSCISCRSRTGTGGSGPRRVLLGAIHISTNSDQLILRPSPSPLGHGLRPDRGPAASALGWSSAVPPA